MAKPKANLFFSTTVNAEEYGLIRRYSDLMGLPKASAIKLHLRQSLPARICELEASGTINLPSVNPKKDTKKHGGSQQKSLNTQPARAG